MRSTAPTDTETPEIRWYAFVKSITNIFSAAGFFSKKKTANALDAHPSPSNLIVVSPNMRTTKPTVVFALQSMPSKHDSSISFRLFGCCWCCSCDTWLITFRLGKSFSLISGFMATAAPDFRSGLGAALLLVGYSLISLWLVAWDLSLLTCWAVIKLLKCCCWWDIGADAGAVVVVVDDDDDDDDDANLRWACFRVHDTTTKYRVLPHRVLSNLTACEQWTNWHWKRSIFWFG